MNSKYFAPYFVLSAILFFFASCTPKDLGIKMQVSVYENEKLIVQTTIATPWQQETVIVKDPYSFKITPSLIHQSEIKIKVSSQKTDQSLGEGEAITYTNHPATFDFVNVNTTLRIELIPIKVVRK